MEKFASPSQPFTLTTKTKETKTKTDGDQQRRKIMNSPNTIRSYLSVEGILFSLRPDCVKTKSDPS